MEKPTSNRNDSLDGMRLIAIFLIIFLHVQYDPLDFDGLMHVVRYCARWCVPFFFMLTGLYLKVGPAGLPDISLERLRKSAMIAMVANLLFMPLAIYLGGVGVISLYIIGSGVFFHLWFINSLVFCFVFLISVSPDGVDFRILLIGSVLGVLLVSYIDVLFQLDGNAWRPQFQLVRFLLATPLVVIGFSAPKIAPIVGKSGTILLIVFGLLLMVIEAVVLLEFDIGFGSVQFPIGCFPFSLGLVLCLYRSPEIPGLKHLAGLGRRHALGIYILHPIALLAVKAAINKLGHPAPGEDSLGLIVALIAGPATLAALVVSDRLTPWFNRLLAGDWPPRRVGS
ncbi:acyltransferase family protein [Novosphingobium album (ex Hu et al. 2023)]|uniref:Acyltransferase family protein n=1 Tax=Novosphingobium album (ex Hu et al. 2023) TaxID=2930093 RepID=A0ABT0B6K0_9SPHN|nr:acyltransferase family protein [Novosphingobium album (ex Hu et al. 2023)]MCJ2180434.1 acyltransferase family protein [Novosphingobium album (ex Hu et al. 2023)]